VTVTVTVTAKAAAAEMGYQVESIKPSTEMRDHDIMHPAIDGTG
jgi:hypothetical protein